MVANPGAPKRSRRGASAPRHVAVRHLSTVTVHGAIAFAHMLGSTAWLTMRVARDLWSSASLGVVALWSAGRRFGIQIASLIQSLGRCAIDWCRQMGMNATASIPKVGFIVGWGARRAVQCASARRDGS